MSIKESITALEEIYEKYPDARIHYKILEFIKQELPERLDSFIERQQRQEQLEQGTEAFINEFLINSEIKYMYIGKSDIFVKYDGSEFKLVNESDILHKILTGISGNKDLLPWKYKIKNMIIKKIKETSLFNTIPESKTIQTVLSFFTPFLFETRDAAKYFLTILGDNILKKQQDLIHLVDIKMKEFITSLSDNIFSYFKNKYHIDTTIKYAWYEHPYKKCRILTVNNTVANSNYWNTFVKYHILDIMAVAVHYSNRFENSDKFAINITSDTTIVNSRYLITHDENTILEKFIHDSIIKVDDATAKISLKEIHYLWKNFLSNNSLPSIIFMSQLKTKLAAFLRMEENGEQFVGVASKYLGNSDILRRFWRDNMVEEIDEDIELTELYHIYKKWAHESSIEIQIGEKTFLSILEHFYEIELRDDKYIKNFKCLLWDKRDEILTILNDLKIAYKFSPDCFEKSIDTVYIDYCNRCRSKFNYRVVNKQEFKKYINQIIPDKYIIRKRILNDYWCT